MNVNEGPWNNIWWGGSWVWLSIFCFLWIWVSGPYLLEMWRLIRMSWLILVHTRDYLSPEIHWKSMGFLLKRHSTVIYHCGACALRTMISHSLFRDYLQETDCGIESSVFQCQLTARHVRHGTSSIIQRLITDLYFVILISYIILNFICTTQKPWIAKNTGTTKWAWWH